MNIHDATEQAYKNGYEAGKPKWIPVNDPPKERGRYLCYYKYEPESPDIICENTYRGDGRWMSETEKVTHWMELPGDPKGE